MRTGTHGAQMMAANVAILEELADVTQAPGSRREQMPQGPSQRRRSGEGPTGRWRWWHQQNTNGAAKGVAKGNGKSGSQAVYSCYGESGVFRSPSGAGGAHWPTSRGWGWRSYPRSGTSLIDVDELQEVHCTTPSPRINVPVLRPCAARSQHGKGGGGGVAFAVRHA